MKKRTEIVGRYLNPTHLPLDLSNDGTPHRSKALHSLIHLFKQHPAAPFGITIIKNDSDHARE
jgi:hypothetical protein